MKKKTIKQIKEIIDKNYFPDWYFIVNILAPHMEDDVDLEDIETIEEILDMITDRRREITYPQDNS